MEKKVQTVRKPTQQQIFFEQYMYAAEMAAAKNEKDALALCIKNIIELKVIEYIYKVLYYYPSLDFSLLKTGILSCEYYEQSSFAHYINLLAKNNNINIPIRIFKEFNSKRKSFESSYKDFNEFLEFCEQYANQLNDDSKRLLFEVAKIITYFEENPITGVSNYYLFAKALHFDSDKVVLAAFSQYKSRAFRLLTKLEGIDCNKYVDLVISFNDANTLCEMVDLVSEKEAPKLYSAILRSNDYEFIYNFAVSHPNINTQEFTTKIIASNDLDIMYRFAKDVPNGPVDLVADKVIELGQALDIYRFARYVPNAPVNKLANRIVELGDANVAFAFSFNVPNVPIAKLAKVVIDSDDLELMYNYVLNIPNDAMIDKIVLSGNYDIIIKIIRSSNTILVNKLVKSLIFIGQQRVVEKDNTRTTFIHGDNSNNNQYDSICYGILNENDFKLNINRNSLLFIMSPEKVFAYIASNSSQTTDELFTDILNSSYSTLFKFYLLNHLTIDYYLYFASRIQDKENAQILTCFSSSDTILQNSLNTIDNIDYYEQLLLLQNKVQYFLISLRNNYNPNNEIYIQTIKDLIRKINIMISDYLERSLDIQYSRALQ